jgi:hypothetical protein
MDVPFLQRLGGEPGVGGIVLNEQHLDRLVLRC